MQEWHNVTYKNECTCWSDLGCISIDITKRSLSVTVSSLVGTLGSMIVIGGTFMLMILPVIDSFSSSTGMINETLPNVVFVTLSLLNAVIGALIFNNTVHRGVRI